MSLRDEEELEKHNQKKLEEYRRKLEGLRKKAETCEIKFPIIFNGYQICPNELGC